MDGSMEQLPFPLKAMVGGRITYIARVLYEYAGEIDPDDGAIEIGINDQVLLLDATADGDRLRVREGAWKDPFSEPLSEDNRRHIESHGKWRWVDCSHLNAYAELIGQPITSIAALMNEHGHLAGVRISVSSRSLWFVVHGDECRVYWAQPIGFKERNAIFSR